MSTAASYGKAETQTAGGVSAGTLTAGAMTVLLALALVYWLWLGITQRTITLDEGISILAAQGILEHGYPVLPSGFIYVRAYLPNYLLAGSIRVLGLNDFAIMLPSLAMALGSLWLVYRLAKDVLGRPVLGVVAASLLVVLQVQTFYATSARMYGPLQFFVLLVSYSAWRGYVAGEKRFQWITFLALLGAILTHREGGALLVAIPVSVLALQWIRGRERRQFNMLLASIGWLFLAGVYAAQIVYQIPGTMPAISAHGGVPANDVGFNFEVLSWLRHVWMLEYLLPFSLVMAPLLAVVVVKSIRRPHAQGNQGTLYTLLVLGVLAAAIMLVIRDPGSRFWFPVLPLYVLLALTGVTMTASWILMQSETLRPGSLAARAGVVASLTLWALTVFFVPANVVGVAGYSSLVPWGFGPPCVGAHNPMYQCSPAQAREIVRLRPLISENDVIVSSDPWVTSYYLGSVQGMLRESLKLGGFTPFDSPTDEYFGIQIVDTADEIIELSNLDRRVWVIINYKAQAYSSQETLDLLERQFFTYSKGEGLTTLVNSEVSTR